MRIIVNAWLIKGERSRVCCTPVRKGATALHYKKRPLSRPLESDSLAAHVHSGSCGAEKENRMV